MRLVEGELETGEAFEHFPHEKVVILEVPGVDDDVIQIRLSTAAPVPVWTENSLATVQEGRHHTLHRGHAWVQSCPRTRNSYKPCPQPRSKASILRIPGRPSSCKTGLQVKGGENRWLCSGDIADERGDLRDRERILLQQLVEGSRIQQQTHALSTFLRLNERREAPRGIGFLNLAALNHALQFLLRELPSKGISDGVRAYHYRLGSRGDSQLDVDVGVRTLSCERQMKISHDSIQVLANLRVNAVTRGGRGTLSRVLLEVGRCKQMLTHFLQRHRNAWFVGSLLAVRVVWGRLTGFRQLEKVVVLTARLLPSAGDGLMDLSRVRPEILRSRGFRRSTGTGGLRIWGRGLRRGSDCRCLFFGVNGGSGCGSLAGELAFALLRSLLSAFRRIARSSFTRGAVSGDLPA